MPVLVITNNTANPSSISDPEHEFSEGLPANATSTFTVPQHTIDNLKAQLDDLAERVDDNGAKEFVVDVQAETDDAGGEFDGVAGLLHWTGNHAITGVVASDPSTASIVSARRVDISAGDVICDAEHFAYAGAADVVGDAEILVDGTDVSAVDLATDEDVYTHFLMVNNAGTLEVLLVRGTGVDNTGALSATPLSNAQLADAVGIYLATGAAYANFIRLADVLYEESTGLSETVTAVPPVPAAYS